MGEITCSNKKKEKKRSLLQGIEYTGVADVTFGKLMNSRKISSFHVSMYHSDRAQKREEKYLPCFS